jgi:hypothetical protein
MYLVEARGIEPLRSARRGHSPLRRILRILSPPLEVGLSYDNSRADILVTATTSAVNILTFPLLHAH